MEDLEITGQITMDRQAMMENQDSKEDMKSALAGMESLSLEDQEAYLKESGRPVRRRCRNNYR